MLGTSVDISLYGNTVEGGEQDTTLLTTFGWLRFDVPDPGHIGAFYFGPEGIKAKVPSPALANYSVPAPTIVPTLPAIVPPPAWAYYKVMPPTIINTSDIIVDFVGVPRVGASPLVVDFTATVTLAGSANGTMLVKEYHWYFDYATNPTVYETSTIPTITHVYTGYYGKKFSVKMCVILK